jgi:hypothetical protein
MIMDRYKKLLPVPQYYNYRPVLKKNCRKVQHNQKRNVAHCKTHEFFFPTENKQVARIKILTGNGLETSESRLFTSFFTKYKERLSAIKI